VDDASCLQRALLLAKRAEGRTAPNPMVGAVVVRDGRVVGVGWHHRAGEPHAEILALEAAGEAARGGTLYVSLEPCSHFGKTPPCADAVAAAGISRVVACMEDPNPKVAGQGFRRLREAGVEVAWGLLADRAEELNRAYLNVVRTGLPWVVLKLAASLDGRVATRAGDSRWITGEDARRHVHRLRDRCDAVMIGAGTARRDNPELTVRLVRGRDPIRVVVSASGRLHGARRLLEAPEGPRTLIFLGEGAPEPGPAGGNVEWIRTPAQNGRVCLDTVLRQLAARGLHSVLCEGGPELAASLLQEGLVREVWWLLAPLLIGGCGALPALGGAGAERLADAWRLSRIRTARFGLDLAVTGRIDTPPRGGEADLYRQPPPVRL
jgi:diaminohydroxyphosphoribosylaminopyrimidine deaminase/5-amino-6-(5-phosphoribosylamino)uracil reductase